VVRLAREHWPLLVAIAVLCAVLAVSIALVLKHSEGHLIYAIDDPYIHMAIARNVAEHGVWGVTRYEFTSSSSSLLWTSLLSLVYSLFGAGETAPLILNILFAIGACGLIYALLRRHRAPPWLILGALLSIVFFSPWPSLVFCGQEHMLHGLLTIWFVGLAAALLAKDKQTRLRFSALLLLAALVVMARYEGLFAVLAVGGLFAARRRWAPALAVVAAGCFPVVIYGLISVAKGWSFLPNPILLKGNLPNVSSVKGLVYLLGYSGYLELTQNPHMLMLLLAGLAVLHYQLRNHKGLWRESTVVNAVFVAATALHMQFARAGWFYRYEAYLVGLGLFALTLALKDWLEQSRHTRTARPELVRYVPLALVSILVVAPLGVRGIKSFRAIPQATGNIYQQQYQMGLFLREFYQGRVVAANDVGAINYLADIRCVDLWGLASLDVARAMRADRYNTASIDELVGSKQAEIAILYDAWFQRPDIGGWPSHWIGVGQWQMPDNLVCAEDTISFYAVEEAETEPLIDNLRRFGPRLPEVVVQSGLYADRESVD